MVKIKIKGTFYTIPETQHQNESLTIVDWLANQFYKTKNKIFIDPIINTITPYIRKVSNSFCRDKEDAKELAQELKIDLLRLLLQWKPKTNMRFNYLMRRQFYNLSCNFVKKFGKASFVNIDQKELLYHPNFIKNDSGEKYENKDLVQKLMELVDKDTKQILMLYLEGHNYEQIGESLQVTGVTVRNKIKKCRPLLQKMLGGKNV